MNLSTPSVQSIKTYLHYRTTTNLEAMTAIDVDGNAFCSTQIVRLTLKEIAHGVCAELGRCISTKTVSLALALLRREGLLITLRSPNMGDVAGFHMLLEGAWSGSSVALDLVERYQERIMTGYDYRRVVPLPPLTPALTPAPVIVEQVEVEDPLSFLEDCNPFEVEEEVADVCVQDVAHVLSAKEEKARLKAERQAEKARLKAEKESTDRVLTAAARPIVECYIAYATEVRGSINYGLIWRKAKELADAGFTADNVTDYISHLRSQNYHKTRFINIVFIRENIGSYLLNATARDGYDSYGRFDIRLTKRAIEENARYERESAERAAANGGVDPGEDKSDSLAMLHAFLQSKPSKQVVATPA